MSDFTNVSIKDQNKSASSSLLKKNIRKFMRNKLAVFGLVVVVVIVGACVFGAVAGLDFNTPNPLFRKEPPSAAHPFGTDTTGRDLFARVLFGGCYSIFIGVFCAVLSSVVGAVLGAIAGYFGKTADMIIVRISEIFQAFPQLVLVMMLVAILKERSINNMLFVFVVTGWMTTFRMVRNEFLALREETYVQVCEAFGMSKSAIMFKQILPNVLSPVIVSATVNVAGFILSEASLSFLGVGVPSSVPTWGNILNAAKSVEVVSNYWWLWAVPGGVISIFVLAINFFGDGLRDVLDPKQQ